MTGFQTDDQLISLPVGLCAPDVHSMDWSCLTDWVRGNSNTTLGRNAGFRRQATPVRSGKNLQQLLWTVSAWSPPILLGEVIADRNVVLRESHFK